MLAGTVLVVVHDEKTGALGVRRGEATTSRDGAPAQTSAGRPTTADRPAPDSAAVELSPFIVTTEKDNGFVAATSLAGGRTATDLSDTPAADRTDILWLTSEDDGPQLESQVALGGGLAPTVARPVEAVGDQLYHGGVDEVDRAAETPRARFSAAAGEAGVLGLQEGEHAPEELFR